MRKKTLLGEGGHPRGLAAVELAGAYNRWRRRLHMLDQHRSPLGEHKEGGRREPRKENGLIGDRQLWLVGGSDSSAYWSPVQREKRFTVSVRSSHRGEGASVPLTYYYLITKEENCQLLLAIF